MNLKYFIPAILWGLFVLVLSTLPGENFKAFQWADFFSADKLIHATFYGVFVASLYWGYKKNQVSLIPLLQITLFCIAFGISMELCQKYLCRGRSFELADILANSIGAVVVYWWLKRKDK